jgi:hypothetical protein
MGANVRPTSGRSMTSGIAPAAAPTAGVPHAIDSTRTSPNASPNEGKAVTQALLYARASASRLSTSAQVTPSAASSSRLAAWGSPGRESTSRASGRLRRTSRNAAMSRSTRLRGSVGSAAQKIVGCSARSAAGRNAATSTPGGITRTSVPSQRSNASAADRLRAVTALQPARARCVISSRRRRCWSPTRSGMPRYESTDGRPVRAVQRAAASASVG